MQLCHIFSRFFEDEDFLDHVASSFAHVQPDGTTLGSGIQNLRLFVNALGNTGWANEDRIASIFEFANLLSVVRVIAQCKNLQSLELRLHLDEEERPGQCSGTELLQDGIQTVIGTNARVSLLNLVEPLKPCLGVLENLEELNLQGLHQHLDLSIRSGYPLIKFKNLKTLKLENITMDYDAWVEFLKSLEGTLENLKLRFYYVLAAPPKRATVSQSHWRP